MPLTPVFPVGRLVRASFVECFIFDFRRMERDLASVTARRVQAAEQIHTGTRIMAGSEESADRRKARRVVGSRLIEAVFSTARVIISSVALPGSGLSRSSASMAFIAKGVAALPMPRMLALILADISSRPLPVRYAVGKSIFRRGAINFESFVIKFAAFKTRMTPHQRHIIPNKERVRVTALAAPSITAFPNACIFPLRRAAIKDVIHRIEKVLPSILITLHEGILLKK